jgi:transcriptional regulator with XRE-family HTH domain
MDNRAIRIASGLTLTQIAVYAGVSPPTARLYEANPESPRADKRAVLESYYAGLAAGLAARLAAAPTAPSPQPRRTP